MQASELVDLVVAVAVAPLLIAVWSRTSALRESAWFVVAYALMVLAYTATIAEGVGGPVGEWLNVVEHAALLAAGVAFSLFARRLLGRSEADRL